MALYDEAELQRSIDEGARKLAQRRQQRRQETRRFWVLVVFLAIFLPLCVVAGAVASKAPSAPSFVVTWPKPKIRQVVAPGQTILAREGQPFSVSVTQGENWNVTWASQGVESGGDEFAWAPSDQTGTLTARCHAISSGWRSAFTWLWPTREISLNSIAASKDGDYRRTIDAGEGVWIYPHIFAAGSIAFDERALPLLAGAIAAVPQSELANQLAVVADDVTPALWQIVGNFDGQNLPAEDATFASLHANELETTLPAIAGDIAQKVPDASVKFVVRLDKDTPAGILRLAFDGSKEHRAWIKRLGESAGGPLTGWEKGKSSPGLLPSLPR